MSCLGLDRYNLVKIVLVDYAQRRCVEHGCRERFGAKVAEQDPRWASRLGSDHILDLSGFGRVSEIALTRHAKIALHADRLSNTFVPGRNLLFFTLMAAPASRLQLRHPVGCIYETDYLRYPDYRDNTLKLLQVTLNLENGICSIMHTPLMWIDKPRTWEMAFEVGGVKLVELMRTDTHSCYRGEHERLHSWGYGCGVCPACGLRQKYCSGLNG